jgi:putative PIN family toxin of toxin-antitoxin system
MCCHAGTRALIVVVDTDVLVSAFLGPGGASREVLRRALRGEYRPLVGAALFAEYESVLARHELFESCVLSAKERERLFEDFLSVCRWTRVYYTWRPNVRDESDNHVVELAVAGGAQAIVTRNVRDFARMELRFPALRIVTPADLAKE